MKINYYIILFFLSFYFFYSNHIYAQQNVIYNYDNINRLSKVTYINGFVVEYTYDELGNRLTKTKSYILPQDAGIINGANVICAGSDSVAYSIPAIKYAVYYKWTLPSGAIIAGGDSTNSILVKFLSNAQSGNISVYGVNDGGNGVSSNMEITINNCNFRILAAKLYLEGLYNGLAMNKAMDENGEHFPNDIADKIQVELHESIPPYELAFSNTEVDLKTNGNSYISVPYNLEGAYYLVIKNRNHIETWSTAPISFTGDTVFYDFTTDATKAYGDNLKFISTNQNNSIINQIPITQNEILELKSFNYNPQRFNLLIIPESNSDLIKIIIIDKVTKKTYMKIINKADYSK